MAKARRLQNIAIVGVGLIGGSIGLAVRKRGLAQKITGIGRRQSSLRVAMQRAAVTSTTTDLRRGVADAELVIICTPVNSIVELARQTAAFCPPDALVTDAGSIKAKIVAALDGRMPRGVSFVGSHPMAGSEQVGPRNARGDLLDGRTVIVTPGRHCKAADVQQLKSFWTALGATVKQITPAEHDRRVAAISHVPHLVAAALAAATTPSDLPYAASGWLDTTRIAAGDVELWEQILQGNRPQVLKSLDRFEKLLASVREAIASGNEAALRKVLKEAKHKRDAAARRKS